MSNNKNSSKKKKFIPNPIELVRDVAEETANTFKNELFAPMTDSFFDQIGLPPLMSDKFPSKQPRPKSGEIKPGQSIEMSKIRSGEAEKNEKLQKQIILEKQLRNEEQILVQKRTNELRIEINQIHEEVLQLAQSTNNLSNELTIAAFQAPVDANQYEINFLKHILKMIKNYRAKIDNASTWMHSANHRAGKKNMWGQNYKKHGAKYLLSGEHYVTRSAA